MSTIQLRRNTAALAAANNVVLGVGEPGVETDTGKFKIGDGVTAWVALPYATDLSRLPSSVADTSSPTTSGSLAEISLLDPRWGVVGDGVTDDSVAIQALLSAVGTADNVQGTRIVIPTVNRAGAPASYYCSMPIHVIRSVQLAAEGGAGSPQFRFRPGVHGFIFHSNYNYDSAYWKGSANGSYLQGVGVTTNVASTWRNVSDAVLYSTTLSASIASGTLVNSLDVTATQVAVPIGTPIAVIGSNYGWQVFTSSADAPAGTTAIAVNPLMSIGSMLSGSAVNLGVMTSAAANFIAADVGTGITESPGTPGAPTPPHLCAGTSIAAVSSSTLVVLSDVPMSPGTTLPMVIAGSCGYNARCQMRLRDCAALGSWGGHGFSIVASVAYSNANGWILENPLVNGATRLEGIHVQGDDTNAGYCLEASINGTGMAGIHDNSFLGNTWIAPQIADCGYGYLIGDSATGANVTTSTLIGPYLENSGETFIGENVISLGNLNFSGTGSVLGTTQDYGAGFKVASASLTIQNSLYGVNLFLSSAYDGHGSLCDAVNGPTTGLFIKDGNAIMGANNDGDVVASQPLLEPVAAVTYAASVAINARAGTWQKIVVTDNSAFTIANPTNPPGGTLGNAQMTMELIIEISNMSGGLMGAVTWGAQYQFAGQAWVNPTPNQSRHVRFRYNGTTWICTGIASADY